MGLYEKLKNMEIPAPDAAYGAGMHSITNAGKIYTKAEPPGLSKTTIEALLPDNPAVLLEVAGTWPPTFCRVRGSAERSWMWLFGRYYQPDNGRVSSEEGLFFLAQRWVDANGGVLLVYSIDVDD